MNIKQNIKSLVVNIAAVAVAIAIGIPLGNLVREKILHSKSGPVLVPIALVESKTLFNGISNDLIVFGDTKCNYCKDGVALLDKIGASYKILYIDKDEQAKKNYETLNTGGVPVLVSRNQYLAGFSEEAWGNFLKGSHPK